MPAIDTDDHVIAARLAAEAGDMLVDLRARLTADGVTGRALGAQGHRGAHGAPAAPPAGVAGRALGAGGDRAAPEPLTRRLAELRRHDAVLSEEGAADPARLAA